MDYYYYMYMYSMRVDYYSTVNWSNKHIEYEDMIRMDIVTSS